MEYNAIKYVHPDWQDEDGQPWLRTIHRDVHSQAFADLAKAWSRYFSAQCERGKAHPSIYSGSHPAPARRILRYPWRVRQ